VSANNGPLRGIEGRVEKRYGLTTVLLWLDFIRQAAAVKLESLRSGINLISPMSVKTLKTVAG
jgi:hypothetical protein